MAVKVVASLAGAMAHIAATAPGTPELDPSLYHQHRHPSGFLRSMKHARAFLPLGSQPLRRLAPATAFSAA